MIEDKVYLPETIKRSPFPNEVEGSEKDGATVKTRTIYQPAFLPFAGFPVSKIVDNIIGISLDTQSRRIKGNFSFDTLGAISIGSYSSGVSGDVKISPNGIVARNNAGTTTFSVDGTTGDATFLGTVSAGSVVTGYIQVGGALTDVGAGNITGTYIANGTITTGKIAAGAITANEIATGAITTAKVFAGAITATEIATNAVTADKILANAITSVKILANAVTADKISVSTLSAISANIGTVTAGSLSGVSIAIGTGNSIFKADSNGIYLGNAVFGSAPFRVSMSGAVTASSISLTNASVGTGSSYTGTAINEAYIGDLNASKITAGTINADRIGAGSITASKIATGTITANEIATNAVTADKISAGSITSTKLASSFTVSGTIQTAYGYATGGVKIGGAGGSVNGLQLGGTYGDRILFNDTVDKLEMHDDLTVAGDTYIGSGSMSFENGYVLTMSSSKSAIVPTLKDGYRALYCMESPEVWFMDIVNDKDLVDPMFEEVTIGEKKFIKTEDGSYLVFARRKGHENKRFDLKTKEEFIQNEKFLQMAVLNK